MLLQFKCSNYRSIKDTVVFSMIAGPDDTREEMLLNFGNYRILPAAVIYGPNGSGKTSLIRALNFVCNLVRKSKEKQLDERIAQFPHKLSKADTPSEYDLIFVHNNVRYAYGFSIKAGKVDSEYLYYFPRNKQAKVFERKGMKIIPGDKYKNSFGGRDLKAVFESNKLLLSCAAGNTSVKEVKEAFRFFAYGISVVEKNIPNSSVLTEPEDSDEEAEDKLYMKSEIVRMLQYFGTNVKEIRKERSISSKGRMPKNQDDFDKDLAKFEKFVGLKFPRFIFRKNFSETKMVYDRFEVSLEREESEGVQKLVSILPDIINALRKGKILVFNELENSLHESVLSGIVKLFNTPRENHGGQLIFSTHNTNLLDSDLFRRDQVWFTELTNKERATDLYSLLEIRNVRKSENLAKGYISGKYGAMQMLNADMLQKM